MPSQDTPSTLPAFPHGAVYVRKCNPPRDDRARVYRTAAEDGMNVFRHWFLCPPSKWPPAFLTGTTTIANSTPQDRPVRLQLSDAWEPYSGSSTLGGAAADVSDRTVQLVAPDRNVTVLTLR